METDLDSQESYDLALETPPVFSPQGSSNIGHHEGQVGFVKYVRPSSPGHLQVDNNNALPGSSMVLLESQKEQPLHSHLPAQFKVIGFSFLESQILVTNLPLDFFYTVDVTFSQDLSFC